MKITFRVDKRGISGGRFVETPLFPLPQRFLGGFCRDRSVAVDNFHADVCGVRGGLIQTCLWRKSRLVGFPQGCGSFVHTFKVCNPSKKAAFLRKMGDFVGFHKLSLFPLCKTSFFHTVFHNLWKSRGKIHRVCAESVEKPWDKTGFSTWGLGVSRLSFP